MSDEEIMKQLFDYAYEKLIHHNAYPFCAFIAKEGVIISKGYNDRVNAYGDKTMHGEMEAIRRAMKSVRKDSKDLVFDKTYTLYSTCEPCLACFETALWANIGRIVFSVDHNDFPEYFHDHNYTLDDYVKNHPEGARIIKGVLKEEGVNLFKFAKRKYGW